MIRYHDILALQSQKERLQAYLHADVLLIFDHLVHAWVFQGTAEYVAIKQHLSQYDQLTELLRLLIEHEHDSSSHTDSQADDRNVFKILCNVLRILQHHSIADQLEISSRRYRRDGSPEQASQCELAKRRMTYTEAICWAHDQVQRVSQQNGGDPRQQNGGGSRQQNGHGYSNQHYHMDSSGGGDPVEGFRSHLQKRCAVESRRTNMAQAKENAGDTYISMMVMSQREALRLAARRGKRKAGRSAASVFLADNMDATNTDSFELRDPVQLLLKRDPTSHLEQSQCNGQSNVLDSKDTAVAAPKEPIQLLKSCMLMSAAGKGKTMACRRVMADYANTKTSSILRSQFDFVIPISCRDTERVSTDCWSKFLGLDHSALHLTTTEREEVLRYLSAHSDRVLILLDGVDEGGKAAFRSTSAAHHFMAETNENLLVNASVIITSRPCEKATDLVAQCMVHYRLTGFTDTQLKDFCCQQLQLEMGERCIAQLSQPSCKHLKQAVQSTPLLAALLCQQFAVSESVPPCTSAFYIQFVCSAITEYEKKHKKQFSKVKLPQQHVATKGVCTAEVVGDDSLEEYTVQEVIRNNLDQYVEQGGTHTSACNDGAELIRALCHLYNASLDSLLQGHAWIAASDMASHDVAICKQLGFLVSMDSHENVPWDSPRDERLALLHLTLQEFFAARWCGMSSDVIKTLSHCVHEVGVGEETRPFWRFICGSIDKQFLPAFFEMMMKESPASTGIQHRQFYLFLLTCLLESSLSSPSSSRHSLPVQSECECLARAAEVLLNDCGELNVHGVHLTDLDVAALCNLLQLLSEIPVLNTSNCNLSVDNITDLAPLFVKCSYVNLQGNDLSGKPLSDIASSLLQSSSDVCRVHTINLGDACLVERDAPVLAKLFQLPGLHTVYVNGNRLGNGGVALLVRNMAAGNCNISTFTAVECGLVGGCGRHIGSLLRALPNLTTLKLHCNHLEDSDAKHVLSALQHHIYVQELDLSNNVLTTDVRCGIVEFLASRRRRLTTQNSLSTDEHPLMMPPRCSLNLTGNDVDVSLLESVRASGVCGDDVVFIADQYVTRCDVRQRTIKDMVAEHGGFLYGQASDGTMASLGEYVATDTSTEALYLFSSKISDAGIVELARKGLRFNRTLRKLSLHDNRITLSGFAAVVDAMRHSPLECLLLTLNPLFHGGGITDIDDYLTLMSALAECGHLRCLALSHAGITDHVATALLAALSGHPSLEILLMDGNNLSESTMKKLVEMKETTPALKLVSLINNKISRAGVQLLVNSPDVMSMDRVWIGGNPCCDDVKVSQPLTYSREWLSEEFFSNFVS
ncbi:uncharacterized protein LOC135817170 [Sycon ciliatum]|uniref:uncharacterized protein LOC135817170 n=1 Tax=Sycon ciliatum TaxID=27933 RepID=UPI0031F64192